MIVHTLQRSLENPSVPLSDFDLYEGGGRTADTGERITRDKALEYSPVWKAISLISGDIAKLGCHIYARDGEGKRRATDHPCYNMLRYSPNPYITAFDFYQTIVAHKLQGNGYAKIYRNAATGYAEELYILNPDYVTPVRVNGEVFYEYDSPSVYAIEPASEVVHIHGMGFDGLAGYDVFEYARNSIGMGRASQQYSNKFFANNGRPSVIIEAPGAAWTDEKARNFLDSWKQGYSGLQNGHKTALISAGMKIHTLDSKARENQLIEAMQYSVRDVSNWFNVPPHKLGDSSRTAYNSLEQENQSYLDEAIDPHLVQFEQQIREKILSETEKRADSHVIEFNRKALLRADMSTRGTFYQTATGGRPWMTPDEVRSAENMNPMGGEAAELKDPTNNFGDGGGGQPDADSEEPDGSDATPPPSDDRQALIDAARLAYRDALSRAMTRLRNQTNRAAKDMTALREWHDQLGEWYRETSEKTAIDEMMQPSYRMMKALGLWSEVSCPARSLGNFILSSGARRDDLTDSERVRIVGEAVDKWQREMLGNG